MSMICPKCCGSFEQRLQCPTCGVRLEYQLPLAGRGPRVASPGATWQESPWGRILVGLLLAQGIYYGLWNLCQAGLSVGQPELLQGLWTTLTGLLVVEGMQAAAVLGGGALAGAGRRQGPIFGAFVGLCNGIIFLALNWGHPLMGQPLLLYAQPLLQALGGLVGGLTGCLIWRPLPPTATRSAQAVGKRRGLRKQPGLFAGPVAWLRILLGAAVVVGGTLGAETILEWVISLGDGKLGLETVQDYRMMGWAIAALAALFGGAVSGSTTASGFQHGLLAGIVAAALLVGIRVGLQHASFDSLLMAGSTALILCMAGGWFGGQLLPPVAAATARRPQYA
jgi:hypothetical protein